MNRANFLASGLSAALCLWTAGAAAADLPPTPAPNHTPPPPVPFSWTDLYIGPYMGSALDGSNFTNPHGTTLFGDNVRSPGGIGGLQIGYNRQYGTVVLGVEADMTAADLDGTFTCLQRSVVSQALHRVLSVAPSAQPARCDPTGSARTASVSQSVQVAKLGACPDNRKSARLIE
jgi:opacity protein-like surface antigen